MLRNVILLSRDNHESIGFLPSTRLEEYAARGQLYHQIDDDEWVGFLVCGPMRFGKACRVYQECIDKTARRYGSGYRLYRKFLDDCISAGCSRIILGCAEDLESNLFWKAVGLKAVGYRKGGEKRKRQIVIYSKELGFFSADGGLDA